MNKLTNKLRALAISCAAAMCRAAPALADDSADLPGGTVARGWRQAQRAPHRRQLIQYEYVRRQRGTQPNTTRAPTPRRAIAPRAASSSGVPVTRSRLHLDQLHPDDLQQLPTARERDQHDRRPIGPLDRYDRTLRHHEHDLDRPGASGTSDLIECSADNGVHGSNAAPGTNVYARNGNTSALWTSDNARTSQVDWSQRTTYTSMLEVAELVHEHAGHHHRAAHSGGGERGREPGLVGRRHQHGHDAFQRGRPFPPLQLRQQ